MYRLLYRGKLTADTRCKSKEFFSFTYKEKRTGEGTNKVNNIDTYIVPEWHSIL